MDDFSPLQLIVLCSVFIGFHVLALPLFFWAMRHRQFTGREQKEWSLDDGGFPEMPLPPGQSGATTAKARVMLGILCVFAVTMLASIFLVVYTALHATAHSAAGSSPF